MTNKMPLLERPLVDLGLQVSTFLKLQKGAVTTVGGAVRPPQHVLQTLTASEEAQLKRTIVRFYTEEVGDPEEIE